MWILGYFLTRKFLPVLGFVATVVLHGATINRIDLQERFGYFNGFPGATMVLSGGPTRYTLSDGTTWDSGSGGTQVAGSTLASISQDAGFINYTFNPLMNSWNTQNVFLQTVDFGSVFHFTEGTLTFTGKPTVVAALGSNVATWTGKVHIQSNQPPFEPSPTFDYFSQPVGSDVFFTSTIVNDSFNWTADSFDKSFYYHIDGNVEFKSDIPLSPVPEPSTYGWFASALLFGVMANRRIRKSKSA